MPNSSGYGITITCGWKNVKNTTEMCFLPVITLSWTITVVGFGERNLIFSHVDGRAEHHGAARCNQ